MECGGGWYIGILEKGRLEKYTWFIHEVLKQISTKRYRMHVNTGLMKPLEVYSLSDEALCLLTVQNYLKCWKEEIDTLLTEGDIDHMRLSATK